MSSTKGNGLTACVKSALADAVELKASFCVRHRSSEVRLTDREPNIFDCLLERSPAGKHKLIPGK